METPSEICYLSAATSPTSICSLEESLSFYSAPTSPTSEVSHAFFGYKTEPTTPRNSYDHDHDHFSHSFLTDHDFEFETSRHFNFEFKEECESPVECEKRDRFGQQRRDSQPMMAFADELFCDGKVVPLAPPNPKLKLPPGFRSGTDDVGGRSGAVAAAAVAEPKSPRSVIGLTFPRQCLWNDDFDPFMVALENVREEQIREKKMEGKNGRRARSLSPLRARPSEYYMGLLKPHKAEEAGSDSNSRGKPSGSVSARWPSPQKLWAKDVKSPTHKMGSDSLKQERKSPKGLAEPKGIAIARRVRRVKMGREYLDEPLVSPVRQPESEKGKKGRGSRRPYTRGNNKRQKIMRLLFRVSSSGKESSDEENKEPKHQNGALWKPTFLRRLSLRSNGQALYNRDKKIVSHVAKMTLIQYRPRLSLCMGSGTRYAQ